MVKTLDNKYLLRDKEHYENISSRIRQMHDNYLESMENRKHKKKNKKKKKKERDMEKMILEKTFETESLPKEYLAIMYKEKTGRFPNENEYQNLLQDMKSKGYVSSKNGKPYEPEVDTSKTEKENFSKLRKEWEEAKKNIEDYLNKNIKYD